MDYYQSHREWLYSAAEGIAVAPDGILSVCGYAHSAKASTPRWIMRRSSDGASTWTVVDNFAHVGTLALATGWAVDGSGRSIVCGYADKAEGYLWLARRGSPGISWRKKGKKLVPVNAVSRISGDEFHPAPGQHARANGIPADAVSGKVFVSGGARDAGAVVHWVARTLAP